MPRRERIQISNAVGQVDGPGLIDEPLLRLPHSRHHDRPLVPCHARIQVGRIGRHHLQALDQWAINVGAPEGVDLVLAGQAEHGVRAQRQHHIVALQLLGQRVAARLGEGQQFAADLAAHE